jgi:pyridoxal phosphate enzyme (YggS family)
VAHTVGALDRERVSANVEVVRDRIAAACRRAGRDPGGVELLAATKYVPIDQMGVLADAGLTLVGENIASELEEKHGRWSDRFTFDFIGHLQSRKTRQVLPCVRLIHSVESESVLRQIERHAEETRRVLLEINVAGEESKYGIALESADAFVEQAARYEKVIFGGLMTMPPLATRPDQARPYFAALRELAESLAANWAPHHDFRALSMGTSQDFDVAVEEGATVVRVGSVLYA